MKLQQNQMMLALILCIIYAVFNCNNKTIEPEHNTSTSPQCKLEIEITPDSGNTSTLFTLEINDSLGKEPNFELRIDWNNDGIWERDWDTSAIDSYKYTSPGSVTVFVELRLNDSELCSLFREFFIADTIVNMVSPVIHVQPQPNAVHIGDTALFSISATGHPNLNYQWALNGQNIDGAVDSFYQIKSVNETDIGMYSVAIFNIADTLISDTVLLAVYDTLHDNRDGQKYLTIRIGSQTWMGENLNIGIYKKLAFEYIYDPGYYYESYATDNDTIEKYAYYNNPGNCLLFGGLYTWNEAMNYTTTEGIQGICPEGWHIPTVNEWELLFNTVCDDTLNGRAWSLGNFTYIGFNILYSGYSSYDGVFRERGSATYFWSSTGSRSSAPAWWGFATYFRYIGYGAGEQTNGACIRCIKDELN